MPEVKQTVARAVRHDHGIAGKCELDRPAAPMLILAGQQNWTADRSVSSKMPWTGF